jgi:hypothetical protein
MGTAARQRIEKCYSLRAVTELLERLLLDLRRDG